MPTVIKTITVYSLIKIKSGGERFFFLQRETQQLIFFFKHKFVAHLWSVFGCPTRKPEMNPKN